METRWAKALAITERLQEDINIHNFAEVIDLVLLLETLSRSKKINAKERNKLIKTSNKYIQLLLDNISNYSISYGVWNGFPQLGYLLNVLNSNGQYNKPLQEINNLLKIKIDDLLMLDISEGNNTAFYDLLSGVSGILNFYIIIFPREKKFICKMISWLCSMVLTENQLRNFKISKKTTNNALYKKNYPNGYIDLSTSHGIIGVYKVLCLAYAGGFRPPYILGSIHTIEKFYNAFLVDTSSLKNYPSICSFNMSGELVPEYSSRNGWCYGSIGISYMFYSGNKLIDSNRTSIYKLQLREYLNLDIDKYGLSCPTLCHGYSGVLLILQKIFYDCSNEYCTSIEDVIWKAGSDRNPYYFEKIDYDYLNNQPIYSNTNLSSLDGIISILLVYFIVSGEIESSIYDQMLFI